MKTMQFYEIENDPSLKESVLVIRYIKKKHLDTEIQLQFRSKKEGKLENLYITMRPDKDKSELIDERGTRYEIGYGKVSSKKGLVLKFRLLTEPEALEALNNTGIDINANVGDEKNLYNRSLEEEIRYNDEKYGDEFDEDEFAQYFFETYPGPQPNPDYSPLRFYTFKEQKPIALSEFIMILEFSLISNDSLMISFYSKNGGEEVVHFQLNKDEEKSFQINGINITISKEGEIFTTHSKQIEKKIERKRLFRKPVRETVLEDQEEKTLQIPREISVQEAYQSIKKASGIDLLVLYENDYKLHGPNLNKSIEGKRFFTKLTGSEKSKFKYQ